jgi:copper chaperone CopZ
MATQKTTLTVLGMHCSSCVRRMERALGSVPGVSAVKVDLAANQATVEHVPGQASEAQLKEAVRAIGFEVPN